MNMTIRIFLFIAILFLPNVLSATEVQEIKSSKGISAWLIEDHSLPIVSISFAWRGGIEQDAEDKQGLGYLAANMLTEGAGNEDANTFQKKLQDNAITLSFQAQRDSIVGQMRSLKETLPIAQEALRATLLSPRFDEDALLRQKAQLSSMLKQYQSDTEWLLTRLMMRETYAGHPYSKRTLGTQQTIASISRDDIKKWHKKLTRDTLLLSVTGDITKQELEVFLDNTFGALPATSTAQGVPQADLKGTKEIFQLNYKGPQTSLMLVWQGINRKDKDWYALEVMNYILGGGSFSSRLMHEIREKRGLTYGVHSGMSVLDHGASYSIEASCKNENAGEVFNLIKKEIIRLRDTSVSAAELKAAKDYLTGSYALSLTSTSRVAGHYLELQRQYLTKDNQQKRAAAIAAVTQDDVQAIAKRLLNDEGMITFLIGDPQGIKPTMVFDSVE